MLPGARGENDAEYQQYLTTLRSKKRVKKQRKKDGSKTALLVVLYILLLILLGDLLANIIGAVTGHLPYNSIGYAALRMAIFGSLILWGISATKKQSKSGVVTRDASIAQSFQCPVCESDTILRMVKKGPDAGRSFNVCIRYPDCKGRVQIRKRAL